MDTNTVMSFEAEHWLQVASNHLKSQDLLSSKKFATRAKQSSPQIEGIDQITAIIDVLLASKKRINNHMDWYSILQIDGRSKDLDFIKRQYKQLVLLLHPDKNNFPCSANAFKLVCDAWNFLSDPNKKSFYDNEFNLFLKFDPIVLNNNQIAREKMKKKKNSAKMDMDDDEVEIVHDPTPSRLSTFWTVCPYCYHLYEYPRVYEDCCLKCQKCRRGFHGVVIPSPPPPVGPGKDLYYCCWAFFPIGFTAPENVGKDSSLKPFGVENVETGKRSNVARDDDDDMGNVGKDSSWKSFDVATKGKRSNIDRDDDMGDVRGEKKGKTDDFVSKNISFEADGAKRGNGMKIGGENNVVKDGFRAKNEEPPKTVKIKTTARKSVKPKFYNPKRAETNGKIDGGISGPSVMGMDLNMERVSVVEERKKKAVAEETYIGSIDNEETEGVGFFEGLDDIIGNLPMLQVPAEQKTQAGS